MQRKALEEMPEELQTLLASRVNRLGYLGEFFQVAAHQPEALGSFVRFTEALKRALPAEITEAVALTVASLTGNHYERIQHENLALKLGLSPAAVRALVDDGSDPAAHLSSEAALVAEHAAAVTRSNGRGCDDTVARLRAELGDAAEVAVTLLVGRYLAHAAISNTWELEAPVASALEEEPQA